MGANLILQVGFVELNST